MTNDIETLPTALYVKIDDDLEGPRRLGRPPVLTASELVCVALAQSLLGFTSETHWLRCAGKHLTGIFPYLPQQSGYNKRLPSALGLVKRVIRMLAKSSDFCLDDCWIVDSTPVPCGMSRQTVKRADLAGWAGYGYCASHSRFYWGLKLYIWCALRPGCRSCGPWPIRRSASARRWPRCSKSRQTWSLSTMASC